MSGDIAAVCGKCDKAFTAGVQLEGLGFHCVKCAEEIEKKNDNARLRPMKSERPPLGLKPRNIHEDGRISDIFGSIARCMDADHKIPIVWIEEYNEIAESRQERRRKK